MATVPFASPIVAADEVSTTRRTPAFAASVTTERVPNTLMRVSWWGSGRQKPLSPATW